VSHPSNSARGMFKPNIPAPLHSQIPVRAVTWPRNGLGTGREGKVRTHIFFGVSVSEFEFSNQDAHFSLCTLCGMASDKPSIRK